VADAQYDRDRLLIQCDSLLSLIFYREKRGLSEQTMLDVRELLPALRRETDTITARRKGTAPPTDQPGEDTPPF